MKGTITAITPKGNSFTEELTKPYPIIEIQRWVGGYFEVIEGFTSYQGSPCIAYCNEEGRIESLPANSRATDLYAAQGAHFDYLVGTIIILQGDDEFMESL